MASSKWPAPRSAVPKLADVTAWLCLSPSRRNENVTTPVNGAGLLVSSRVEERASLIQHGLDFLVCPQ